MLLLPITEHEGSLPCLPQAATCPYPETIQPTPHSLHISFKIHFSFPQRHSTVKPNTYLSFLSEGLRKVCTCACTSRTGVGNAILTLRGTHGCDNLNYWTTGLYKPYGGLQYETRYTSKRFEQREVQKARNLRLQLMNHTAVKLKVPKLF